MAPTLEQRYHSLDTHDTHSDTSEERCVQPTDPQYHVSPTLEMVTREAELGYKPRQFGARGQGPTVAASEAPCGMSTLMPAPQIPAPSAGRHHLPCPGKPGSPSSVPLGAGHGAREVPTDDCVP